MGNLEEESGGASSAVGTVLMVALAIVGTMALGVFVFDLSGTQTDPSPDAYLDFSFANRSGNLTVTISHRAGNQLSQSTISVVASESGSLTMKTGPFSAGEPIVKAANVSAGETIRVIHSGEEGSYVLAQRQVPPAGSVGSATPIPGTSTSTPTTTTNDAPGFAAGAVWVALALVTVARRRGLIGGGSDDDR